MSSIVIPDGHVFVLGENRDRSIDSRFWGTVPIDDIYRIARLFILPTTGAGLEALRNCGDCRECGHRATYTR